MQAYNQEHTNWLQNHKFIVFMHKNADEIGSYIIESNALVDVVIISGDKRMENLQELKMLL